MKNILSNISKPFHLKTRPSNFPARFSFGIIPLEISLMMIFSLVTFSSAFGATASLSWNANTEPDLAGYKVYYGTVSGSYGSPTSVGNTTNYTVTGLANGSYFFAVTAIDTSGNESGFSNEVSKTISTGDTAPPILSGINAGSISSSGVTISWSSNEASDSRVEYGTTTSYGSSTSLDTSLVTSHSQNLNGLASATLYHYRVLSRDSSGNTTTSADSTFTTSSPVDTIPPAISGVVSSNITTTGATITWTTDETSDSQIDYGTTSAYGSSSALDTTLKTPHSLNLSGLNPDTTYHFRVLSRDTAGNLATSGDGIFKTLNTPDITAPVISGIISSGITATGAIVTWSTDERASSQVNYGTTSAYGSSTSNSTSLVTSHSRILSGLSASTTYHYQVRSSDAVGNEAISEDRTFTTAASAGLTITNLNVGSGLPYEIVNSGSGDGVLVYIDRAYTSSGVPSALNGKTYIKTANDDKTSIGSAFLTFTINQDAIIYVAHDDRISAKPSWLTAFTDTGDNLNIQGNAHSLFKKSFPSGQVSLGGNEGASDKRMYAVIIESGGGGSADTTPPLLAGVVVGNITSLGAVITWSTDEAATSQIEYGTTTTYGSLSVKNATLVTNHSRSLSGLNASTIYHYRLISVDAFGNQVTGSDRTFITESAGLNGPTLSNISSGNISETAATITWTTDQAATSQIDYGLTSAYGSATPKNDTLLFTHNQTLTGLLAERIYHFRVKSIDTNGNLSFSSDKTFQTKKAGTSDTTPPDDVLAFNAVGGNEQVTLSWKNPSDLDFVGVRIRYRTDRFPGNINDGTLLGDISGLPNEEMTTSHSGLVNGITYYYLAASYDGNSNFQSTVFASSKTGVFPTGSQSSDSSSEASGGCGMIFPMDGNSSGPGNAAGMLTITGTIILMLTKTRLRSSLRKLKSSMRRLGAVVI